MEELPKAVLGVLLRWVHITSVVILIGGIFYARFFAAGGWSEKFRPWIYGTVLLIVPSGVYNLLTKAAYPPGYHIGFGIKMLLALHIFVAALLMTLRPFEPAKRARSMTGIVISALFVFLISAWLRWISLG